MGCYSMWVLQLQPEKGNSPTALSLWKRFWETTDLFLACWRKKMCESVENGIDYFWNWQCTERRQELLLWSSCRIPDRNSFFSCSLVMYLSLSAKGLLRHSCRDQGSVLLHVWPQVTSLLSCLTAARWWPAGTRCYLGYSICFICFWAHFSALEEKWSWQVCVLLGILSMKTVSAALKPMAIISSMSLFELTFSLKKDCSLAVVAVILMQGQPCWGPSSASSAPCWFLAGQRPPPTPVPWTGNHGTAESPDPFSGYANPQGPSNPVRWIPF